MNTSNTTTTRPYCCGNCPHFVDNGEPIKIKSTDVSGRTVINTHPSAGECHYSPPTLENGSMTGRWPKVYHFDFCACHPSTPMDRTEQLLALIAQRLEVLESSVKQSMPQASAPSQPVWMSTGR